MQPTTIQFSVRLRVGYVRTTRISRENNIIQIDLPDSSTNISLTCMFTGDVWGTRCPDSLNCFNKTDKMDSKIGFEMSLIVVEAIRGRCTSFMIHTATVSEIFGGQTNSSILVV